MNKRLILITLCLIIGLITVYQFNSDVETEQTFSGAIVKYGSAGNDVRELQGRLKYLGFYNGKIDGDFGSNTLKSVKWFQWEFGLTADGVVGPKTKLKLWESTKAWRPQENIQNNVTYTNHSGYSTNDLNLMANAVHGEARGEPYIGQVAVAAVILNRIESEKFPNTISGVIFQPLAFTAVADGQIWLTPNEVSKKAVMDAINGWDPSGGCIYYFNPNTATSSWIWSRPQVKQIGRHIFAK
ncbi:spore cortex-lytic enzyme [Chengkuizengella sediminis]|uniref:spore cortex-lytic enzyme n=1 Tax=Chengkuizengella sediminis TaxID=1885917 RepID=UPI00138A0D4F|nr:spore cortex-lytic enzyme [Chengkuizengella sediminis]NDI33328.1 spore cortex-lytic enzyme [Chengkuizengella sediminis]